MNSNSRQMGNWLAISRDIEKHPIVGFGQPVKPADPKRGSYSRGEAWQSLLFQAQYIPSEVVNKGRTILLERGQLMAGLQHLAERWNWTIETVRWFLSRLEKASMAEAAEPNYVPSDKSRSSLLTPIHPKQNTTRHHNTVKVLEICNYRLYQVAAELNNMLDPSHNPKRTPSEPQESNKETNKQETTQSAPARFEKTKEGMDRLEAMLLDACNGAAANPAAAPALLSMAEPIRWIEGQCDIDLDIIPTIKARAAKAPRGSIRTWSYFTQAIADARAKRLEPMPEGNSHVRAGGDGTMAKKYAHFYDGVL